MNLSTNARRAAGVAALAASIIAGAPLAEAAASVGGERGDALAPRSERQIDRGTITIPAGTTAAVVNGAVARGNWHHWGVRAQAGQTLAVTVGAAAGNATFELYTPSGDQLANDVTSSSVAATQTGFYAIDVGSTGGLANYTLTVSVTGTPTPTPPPPAPGPGNLPGPDQGLIDVADGSGTVSGTVSRPGYHHWGFRAAAGQTFNISASGGATFEVYPPSGDVQLADDVTSFIGTATETGFYAVDIGPSNGTADYTLAVTVSGSPAPPPGPGNLPRPFQGRLDLADGSATVNGTVPAGGYHEWSFRAVAGQPVTVSLSGGAEFNLYEPDGDQLVARTTSFSGTLAESGFYMVELGAGANRADYTLGVTLG